MMRLLIILLLSMPFTRGEEEPFARARIGTEGEIWTGQKVTLVVELLAPGYFTGAPAFDLPKIPGCLIVPPVSSPVVSSETRGDRTFTLQRHELMVFPHRPGKIEIPPFQARFSFKRAPLDKDPVAASVSVAALAFEVSVPPGDAARATVTSADLKVSESWSSEPGKRAKPGDAFVRTITWSASDLTGMAFPPFPDDRIPGLAIYRKPPFVEDASDRGELRGGRVDVITYVCKGGGNFVIPAYRVRWWDPAKKSLQTVEFPPRAFTVFVPPPPPEPFSRRASRYLRAHGRETALGLASLILAVSTFRLWWPVVVRFQQRLRPRHLPPLNPFPSP
ncbi:BatD family protein [Luteolibacter yonseiensis]|uniref:BatD family protein n=1 Tax=Luteolibacter yonseiensis TaxID=1144680 RepID=A0A934QZU0_9BACT|nr:BatD family protein [Luteolibacter yonseiensis]MBK1814077.1 BatD family protein [Luteolibacter yonseiensis]